MSEVKEKRRRGDWTLWAGVIVAFALLIAAWTTIILVARAHPTEPVPLENFSDDPQAGKE